MDKRKRVAVASFEFEGNDFSPKINGWREFGVNAEGEGVWALIDGNPLAVTGGVEVLRADGNIDLIPILVAQGGSGGEVDPGLHTEVVEKIVQGIRKHHQEEPLDGIYLALHGAMITNGVRDCEGELLEKIRAVVGAAPVIAVSLDLHANVTEKMVCHADALVGYENYPHDDAHNTGRRACDLLVSALRGAINPVMCMTRVRMLVPVPGGSTRGDTPLSKVKKFARGIEGGSVLSTSYFTCQPWLDDDEATCVALAIVDGNRDLALSTSQKIAEQMWELREDFFPSLLPVGEAIELAKKAEFKPAILADAGDCVGAGATGDTAQVLEAMIAQAGTHRCALSIVDAAAAEKAISSGPGASVELTLGYSVDPRFGAPVSVQATVRSVHDGKFRYGAGPSAGVTGTMGPSAVVAIGSLQLLIASQATYEYADEQYRSVGMNPEDFDIVVLKNVMNFRNLLKENTSWYLMDSVGSSSNNLVTLPWKNRKKEFWPRTRDLALNLHSTFSGR